MEIKCLFQEMICFRNHKSKGRRNAFSDSCVIKWVFRYAKPFKSTYVLVGFMLPLSEGMRKPDFRSLLREKISACLVEVVDETAIRCILSFLDADRTPVEIFCIGVFSSKRRHLIKVVLVRATLLYNFYMCVAT